MALAEFPNKMGVRISPGQGILSSINSAIIDAAGERCAFIGHVYLSTGPGTSATLSNAGLGGSKIFFQTGSITFVNAGTNFRVGVQDVSLGSGFEDGTFDVQADVAGGSGLIAGSTINFVEMTSGTKTITHGDLIAVVFEMTARGGADIVRVNRANTDSNFPYTTTFLASVAARQALGPICTILFDDNDTVGWFGETAYAYQDTSTSFNSGSSPDEYALVLRVQQKMEWNSVFVKIGDVDPTDAFEIILYSDPLGTPVAERTISHNPLLVGSVSAGSDLVQRQMDAFQPALNTYYALAVRPTTTNPLTFLQFDFGSSLGRKATMLGTDWFLGSRTNQTGAFSQVTSSLPYFGLLANKLDDGASSGGGRGGRFRTVRGIRRRR